MEIQQIPSIDEARKALEERLTRLLSKPCEVDLHSELGDNADIIEEIDTRQFRKELQYSEEELREYARNQGFILIIVHVDKKPIAMFFGYNDSELPGGFYGDTLASLIESKGIGSALFAFVHLICYQKGYSHFSCRTEELDEKGRHLREWYIKAGMSYLGTDKKGDYMRVKLTENHVSWMFRRFILGNKTIKTE